ncbi:uncharacterized protein LOC135810425 [Sycon ciliatum]|uniref:uncharacterized protein LOC135810425 n=1 Tax=Sycon ciliatum TaxID=27933 RepID=UPI0031F62F31
MSDSPIGSIETCFQKISVWVRGSKVTILSELSRCTQTTQRKLDHFLGKLSFASSVVVPGRTFTRRLWDINKRFSRTKPYFRITLTGEARKDIRWWQLLIQHWNGKAFLLYNSSTSSADLGLYTDASGTLGWGAFYGKEQRWIQGSWTKEQEEESIGYKELYAVAMACSTWGHLWSQQRIVLHCENQSVVECLQSSSSKSPGMMSLLRALFFVCATHSFTITAKYVPGHLNSIADALSRFNLQAFQQLAPSAKQPPDTAIRLPLLD